MATSTLKQRALTSIQKALLAQGQEGITITRLPDGKIELLLEPGAIEIQNHVANALAAVKARRGNPNKLAGSSGKGLGRIALSSRYKDIAVDVEDPGLKEAMKSVERLATGAARAFTPEETKEGWTAKEQKLAELERLSANLRKGPKP